MVAGREIGFSGLLVQIYSIIGRYYSGVVSPRARAEMGAVNYAAAVGFVPICAAGVPLIAPLVSYVSTSAVSALVHRSVQQAEGREPNPDWVSVG